MKTYFLETIDFIYIFTDFLFNESLENRIKEDVYRRKGKKAIILPVREMKDLKSLLSGEIVNSGIYLPDSEVQKFC